MSPQIQALDMQGYKVENLATATAISDAVRLDQVQNGGAIWGGTSEGSANVHTITLSPSITAYVTGQMFAFKAGFTNTSTTTLNVSGVGARDIRKYNNQLLVGGEIIANQVHVVIYDGTQFILVSDQGAAITTWAPTYGAATGSTSSPTTSVADFKIIERNTCWFAISGAVALSGGPSAYLTLTLPFTATFSAAIPYFSDLRIDSGSYENGFIWIGTTGTAHIYRGTTANWADTTASNKHEFRCQGIFRI